MFLKINYILHKYVVVCFVHVRLIFPKDARPCDVKRYRLVNPYPMLRRIVVSPSSVASQNTCSLILSAVNVHLYIRFD